MKQLSTFTDAGITYTICHDNSATSGSAFYTRMGRFFADPDIRAAIQEPMNDGPGYEWFLAMDGQDTIAGFACLNTVRTKGDGWLTYAYTLPDHRHHGIHRQLFLARLNYASLLGLKRLRGVALDTSFKTFMEHGFQVDYTRGKDQQFRYVSKVL